MGFRIREYDISELHKIAVPGKVPPCLFWAIPVGNWEHNQLESLWNQFTDGESSCKSYGLLLLKEEPTLKNSSRVDNYIDLAKISDLLPSGAIKHSHFSRAPTKAPGLLVISGGYPQPGWGLLINLEDQHYNHHPFNLHLEEIIASAIHKIDGDSSSGISTFRKATEAFYRWKERDYQRPKNPNDSEIIDQIRHITKIINSCSELLVNNFEADISLVQNNISQFINLIKNDNLVKVENEIVDELIENANQYANAFFIINVERNVLDKEVIHWLKNLIDNPSEKKKIADEITDIRIKHALRVCVYLNKTKNLKTTNEFISWASENITKTAHNITRILKIIDSEARAKIKSLKAQRNSLHNAHKREVVDWENQITRTNFHALIDSAAQLQWELGPKFLINLEKICRNASINVINISWDPARMVGWKVHAYIQLDSNDLAGAIQELAPNAINESPIYEQASFQADGSYFTDYVHFITISRPGFSPRKVSHELLKSLLRPREIIRLIEDYSSVNFDLSNSNHNNDKNSLVEILLNTLGWKGTEKIVEKPLAACIRLNKNSELILSDEVEGNELRIILESFCKDIIDIIISQLGYSNSDVWEAIEEKIPEYRAVSHEKNWAKEVGAVTLGASIILIKNFAPLAFSDKSQGIKKLTESLRKLSIILNNASHHREDVKIEINSDNNIPQLISNVIDSARSIIEELPWHMETSFIYGEQPKVISGEAWSHGYSTPRLLRAILWSSDSVSSRVMIWNKSKINPVVPDAHFIVRPNPNSE